jgi:hypothetical protein
MNYVEVMRYLVVLLLFVFGSWSDVPYCIWRVETRFFEPRTVKEAFDLYRVFQSQWNPIITRLLRNVRDVPRRVREKARMMRPDPFEYPYDAERIKALIYETEFEVFREALVYGGFYDLSATYAMFDYIKTSQERWVDACLDMPRRSRPDLRPRMGQQPLPQDRRYGIPEQQQGYPQDRRYGIPEQQALPQDRRYGPEPYPEQEEPLEGFRVSPDYK